MENKELLDKFDIWLSKNTVLNEKSRRQYILQIKKFFDNYNELSVDNFRDYLFLRKKGRTVYSRRYAIKRFLQFQKREDWVKELEPIMKSLKLQTRRYDRYIDFTHFKEFLDYLTKEHQMLSIMLMILWDTGMRISPIVNMKVRDIKKDSNGHYVTAVEKGGELKNRYLDDYTSKLLNEVVFTKSPEDYVFREKVSNKWESWWQCYYRMWKELKVTSRKFLNLGFGISFHWIRTSRAKELYKKYKDLLKVKGFLGHKRTATTERYIEEGEVSSAQIIKDEEGKWRS